MSEWFLELDCGHRCCIQDEGYEPPAAWCGWCQGYIPVSSGYLVGDAS